MGPNDPPVVKRANGTDRWLWGHMSTKEPPPFVIAVEPKKPDRHRNIRRVQMLGDTAQHTLKTTKSNMVTTNTMRLPPTSEYGPNSNGPNDRPTRKNETPKVATVSEHFNDVDTASVTTLVI